MRYLLLMPPDGDGPTLIGEGETPEATAAHLKIQEEFDGSVPTYEFVIPPPIDTFYAGEDVMELTSTQRWVIAKMIQDAFRAGYEHGTNDDDDRPLHCPECRTPHL